jgi:F-type H+-transporting ATPase subunit b
MQIDWWTLALQAVNFLVLVWLLWRFLYRPVKEVIEKRKQLAEHAFAEAAEKGTEADAARKRFEQDRAALAQERQDMLKKMHEELEAERRKVTEQAKREADELLDSARKTIEEERKAALTDVRGQVAELAADLASDLLRKAGAKGSSDVFLEHLETQLNDLPADERERLQKDLAPDGASLTVVTASPLTAEERDRWADRLGACLGQRDKTDFTTDPNILGGVEIRFPHAVIRSSWADQLRKAKELLRSDEAAS